MIWVFPHRQGDILLLKRVHRHESRDLEKGLDLMLQKSVYPKMDLLFFGRWWRIFPVAVLIVPVVISSMDFGDDSGTASTPNGEGLADPSTQAA